MKKAAPALAQIPTLGRIVLLRGRNAGAPPPPAGVLAGLDMAAIVTNVHTPDIIDATVFAAGAAPNPCLNLKQGDLAGQWYWPPK
jgi:hypothetical protein